LVILTLQYTRKRSGGEVHVEFDNGTKLVVDPDLSVQFQLSRGMMLTEERHQELVIAQERLSARRRLIRNLALRKKTAKEAQRWLRELKFPDHAITYAVKVAQQQGYINDEEYAQLFARAQDRSARKGPRAIKQELQARGVDRHIAAEAVAPLEDPARQREAARQVAEKKVVQLAREPDATKARLKLHQFLMRKGYDAEIALEVTRDLLRGELADEEL
jgi:regulatory protein